METNLKYPNRMEGDLIYLPPLPLVPLGLKLSFGSIDTESRSWQINQENNFFSCT
jgi:hypothetical protein